MDNLEALIQSLWKGTLETPCSKVGKVLSSTFINGCFSFLTTMSVAWLVPMFKWLCNCLINRETYSYFKILIFHHLAITVTQLNPLTSFVCDFITIVTAWLMCIRRYAWQQPIFIFACFYHHKNVTTCPPRSVNWEARDSWTFLSSYSR